VVCGLYLLFDLHFNAILIHDPLDFTSTALDVMFPVKRFINTLYSIVMIIIPFNLSDLGKDHGVFILATRAAGNYPLIIFASGNFNNSA